MILQRIQFPTDRSCREEKLYFHIRNNHLIADTYFNSFSIGKWKKYTDLCSLSLVLQTEGSMQVTLFHMGRNKEHIRRDNFSVTEINAGTHTLSFPTVLWEDSYQGIVGFEIEKRSKDARLVGGYYEGENGTHEKPVRLAIDICTYKREAFVKRNLSFLQDTILGEKSPISNKVEIFIADNGGSLQKQLSSGINEDSRIHIYPNKNVGGAGGFTRGMLEILHNGHSQGFVATHILIMDDDVVMNPYSIEQMMAFLAMRTEHYKELTIGGSMFLMSAPFMQYEAGAAWVNSRVVAGHPFLDLRHPLKVIVNEEEDLKLEYSAWWFCCIPAEIVREDNLPLPIFVHKDDVEYGLRNCKNVVTLNGIAVWHDDFDNKFSGTMHYYDQRNDLLVSALHKPEVTLALHKKLLFISITRSMMKLRYNEAWMRLRGAVDYLKGIDWLMEQDAEELHQEIMGMNYHLSPIEEFGITREQAEQACTARSWKKLEIKTVIESRIKWIHTLRLIQSYLKKLVYSLTFNGCILPAKQETVIAEPNPPITKLFRAGRVIHYDLNGRAYETHRNRTEVLRIYREYRRVCRLLDREYEQVSREYKERYREMTSEEFWRKYLGLLFH